MNTAFLDRDGTIVSDYPDEVWSSIHQPELLPGALEGLQAIRGAGFAIIIVTNQYLIEEGFITPEQYEDFNAKMMKMLDEANISILDIFYCPHSRDAGCDCCKPKPGMIHAALEKYPGINLSGSFLAGDSETDIQLADRVGLRSFGIKLDSPSPACTRVESLRDISQYL